MKKSIICTPKNWRVTDGHTMNGETFDFAPRALAEQQLFMAVAAKIQSVLSTRDRMGSRPGGLIHITVEAIGPEEA